MGEAFRLMTQRQREPDMRHFLSVFTAFLFFVSSSSLAISGPLAEGAAKAESLIPTDASQAATIARFAAAEFISKLPIVASNATFVSGSPEGFRMYDKREPVFKTGEPLITYAEVGGLDWKKGGRGSVSGFVADLQLLATDGTVLAEQAAFGNFTFNAVEPSQEVMAVLTLTAGGLPAGEYKVRYVLKDANSADTTTIEQSFKIVE